jgi:hypothetical protein
VRKILRSDDFAVYELGMARNSLEAQTTNPDNVADAVEAIPERLASEGAPAITREQRRSRRKRAVRARTISVKRMTKRELEVGRLLYPEDDYWKPRERSECSDGPRPCPYVSCQHHLYVDVSPRTGAIKLNFPDLELWEMGESCALDVADRGGTTLEDVGAIMNLTRERIRQVEVKALAKLEAMRDMDALRDFVDAGPRGKRRLPRLSAEELAGIGSDPEDSESELLDSSESDQWDAEVAIDPAHFEDLGEAF